MGDCAERPPPHCRACARVRHGERRGNKHPLHIQVWREGSSTGAIGLAAGLCFHINRGRIGRQIEEPQHAYVASERERAGVLLGCQPDKTTLIAFGTKDHNLYTFGDTPGDQP